MGICSFYSTEIVACILSRQIYGVGLGPSRINVVVTRSAAWEYS